MRVLEQASEDKIWAFNSGNYYDRNSSTNPFRVVAGDAPSTLNVNSNFQYSFQTQNANGSLVYAYFGLPDGLVADRKTGKISGTISQPGIYTLGCEVADQTGSSAEGFVTITVLGSNQTQLSNVQLDTKVLYKFDLNQIRQ